MPADTQTALSAPRMRGLRAVAPGRQQGRGVSPAYAGVEGSLSPRRSRRGGGRSQSWCSFPRGCTLTRRAGIEDASIIFNPRRLSLPVLAVTVRRPGEPQCDQRDHQPQHRRYRADDGENLVHGSSSLCSWGIGRSRWFKCMPTYRMGSSPGGSHKQWGRPRKRGGCSKHPTPSRNRGTPTKQGGRGINTRGGGIDNGGYPTTEHPNPVTKPQHASVHRHLHTVTETRIIRT